MRDLTFERKIVIPIILIFISLHCSCIRRLFDNNFHDSKVIPLILIRKFGENFKFHSFIVILFYSSSSLSKKFLLVRVNLSFPVSLASTVTCQFYGSEDVIKVDGKCIYFRDFTKKKLNFVGQLFDLEGKLKHWTAVKNKTIY